ncbi:hypothetical protein [Oceanisphaera pacifica]|uniref:Uncharacterized protein n=1 Tax=Oceanisphaera pacifica TaxID=2818389 RepID=A0ABS3NFV2_9GAMM|nr:hypothetical protein [Oceanisphaera pacifica]MBO1519410.1 hypothetical protein [Oceanisphaera pacifica]
MRSVPERNWKLFRRLQAELLATASDLVFKKVERLSQDRAGKEHQSYLDLYCLIKEEDEKIAQMFNNPTRNNVLFKIGFLKQYGILSDEQFQLFSEETQKRVTPYATE